MAGKIYRFMFQERERFGDVRDSLSLAIIAAEGLHGKAQVQLEAGVWIDEQQLTCAIDAATESGRSIAKIFTGLVQRLVGDEGFYVDRVTAPPAMESVSSSKTVQ